jgi:hypothetical protein
MNQSPTDPSKKRARLRKIALIGLGVVAVAFVGIQFVPVEAKENPKVIANFSESPEVEAILRRACYDCHSHEVRWPWYSRWALVLWLVARDVKEGRESFNFSDWPEDEEDRQFNREAAWEMVEDGEMPPWFYIYPMHLDAALSEQDQAVLKKWATEKAEAEE